MGRPNLKQRAETPEGHKWCRVGNHFTPISDFAVWESAPDKLAPYCKVHMKHYRKKDYVTTKEAKVLVMTLFDGMDKKINFHGERRRVLVDNLSVVRQRLETWSEGAEPIQLPRESS